MAIPDILVQIAVRFGQILGAPLKQPDMLWILIPIYLNWIFTDYFQERKGTDFGNAMTNGVVTIWVGMDWIRQSIKNAVLNMSLASKIGLSAFFIIYGLIIMVESARAKKIVHYIGRVREVSYVMIVMTPVFYGVIKLDLITLAAILVFFPIWYLINEAVDRILPAPPGEEDVLGKAPDLGAEMPDMGMQAQPMQMPQQGFQQQYPSQYPQKQGQMPKF